MYQELRVRRVVADSLGVGLEELLRDVSLRDDLAADSLDLVELALALEVKFGISVPERVLDWVRSYGDLVEATVDLRRARRAAESRSAEQPTRFVARVVPSEGRSGGILERGGWLTPYTVETIAEDALHAGRGARLEVTVAASTEDTGLARVRDDFACLGERGILVTVWREDENGVPDQHLPVAGGATINARPPLTSELLSQLTGVPTAVTVTEYFGEDPWQTEDLIACTGKDDRRFGDATPAEQTQALSGRGPYQFVESERGVASDRATAGDHHVHAHIHNGQAPAGSVHITEESPPRLAIGRGSAWNQQYYQTDLCTRLGPNGELLAGGTPPTMNVRIGSSSPLPASPRSPRDNHPPAARACACSSTFRLPLPTDSTSSRRPSLGLSRTSPATSSSSSPRSWRERGGSPT
jgi:acyl carrier protein